MKSVYNLSSKHAKGGGEMPPLHPKSVSKDCCALFLANHNLRGAETGPIMVIQHGMSTAAERARAVVHSHNLF